MVEHAWWHWLTADREIAIAGLGLTTAGFAVALWQLWRTKKAADRAVEASLATKQLLRTGDLGRLIEASLGCQRRLAESRRQASAIRIVLSDWLEIYAKIVALLKVSNWIASETVGIASKALAEAKGHILLAHECTGTQHNFRSVNMTRLTEALSNYATRMNEVALELEVEEVAAHVG